MKKAILLLSFIVMFVSCSMFSPRLDISGDWTGTSTTQYGTRRLDMSIIQNGDNLSGTWSSGWGIGGNSFGTISGKKIQGTLSGSGGYSATINGTVTSGGMKQIIGSGTDQGGRFTFQLRKI